MTPPDLSTREGRLAYRRELRGVARSARWGGIGLALLGAAIGATRFLLDPWPASAQLAALVLCIGGLVLMSVGLAKRTRYHLRRIAGTDASNAR